MKNIKFLLKTAFRDSRKHRVKLVLFMSSIILGIAALVAINSFNENLINDIEDQSAALLGADVVMSANKVAPPELIKRFDEIPGESASELSLFSMAFIPKTGESQFVNIKAIKGGFPFYGKLNTKPENAAKDYQSSDGALVDNSILLQYGLEIGDTIKLGEINYQVLGRLFNAFGSAGITSSFAPAVYISQKRLEETGLISDGSLINYSYFKKSESEFEVDKWKKENRKDFRAQNMRITTISGRKENLKEAYSSLNYFLNLVALISLLLGCIGVASSVFIYIKTKIPSIAIFRCLGMQRKEAFFIYFMQIFVLGFLGVLIGALLGTLVQLYLPKLFNDFLPFEVTTQISWRSIAEGIGIGTIVTLLFSLLPLTEVWQISPLKTLRSSDDTEGSKLNGIRFLLYALIVLSLFGYLWFLSNSLIVAGAFVLGLIASFLVLFSVASIVIYFVRRFLPKKWSFVFRQGLSNLFRPNNQTRTLIVSMGLGTMILTTLFIIQGLLLSNVGRMESGDQPNVILYGITADQKDTLADLTKSFDMPVIQQVPVVTMKLDGWKGKTKKEWEQDTTIRLERWASNREIRTTYRSTLESTEKLLKGKLYERVNGLQDSIYISLGEDYADGMKLDLEDEMIWNVQGTKIKTYVGSIRAIDYANMNARFFIVFPEGVLEKAPQFQLLITKTSDDAQTASYRSAVVKSFPNISVVDLGSILSTLNGILSKISYVIKFMAAFSILTGLIVLLSSLLLSRFQRVKESVLLRTLGASKKQILRINATEYFILGSLASLTGIGLSLLSAYLIATYQFKLAFDIEWWPILFIFLLITGLTVIIGLLNSREVLQKSPLEILRNELN